MVGVPTLHKSFVVLGFVILDFQSAVPQVPFWVKVQLPQSPVLFEVKNAGPLSVVVHSYPLLFAVRVLQTALYAPVRLNAPLALAVTVFPHIFTVAQDPLAPKLPLTVKICKSQCAYTVNVPTMLVVVPISDPHAWLVYHPRKSYHVRLGVGSVPIGLPCATVF